MRPASPHFLASLREPHLIASRCDLHFPGVDEPVTVPVAGGEITIDRTAEIRRTGQISIPWSLEAGQDLGVDVRVLPLGGTAAIWRGIRYADGSTELVGLGRFRVESVSWRTIEGVAGLELADRMAQVRDERFLVPYAPPGGEGVTVPATLTDLSPVVTVTSTTGILPGVTVSGVGIPTSAGIRVLTVDSATQVTLTGPARLNVVLEGDSTPTDIVHVSSTEDLAVGMDVAASGGPDWYPAGTKIARVDSATDIAVNVFNATGALPFTFTFTTGPAQTLTFGQGKLIADAAVEIVQAVYGDTIAYRKRYDPPVIVGDTYYTDSRSKALAELASAAAAEQYFDGDGDYIFDVPAGTTPPVWTVDAGEHGVLVDADESLDRTGVYNGVLVEGQQTADQPPVVALVVDDDPTSPTVWGGPFGKVVRTEQSPAVQTVEQAEQAATVLLEERLRVTRSLSLVAAPNPALEAGDVVTVVFADGRTEQHLLDVVGVGLGPQDAQTLVCRSLAPAAVPLPARPRLRVRYGPQAFAEARGAQVRVG